MCTKEYGKVNYVSNWKHTVEFVINSSIHHTDDMQVHARQIIGESSIIYPIHTYVNIHIYSMCHHYVCITASSSLHMKNIVRYLIVVIPWP